MMTLRASLRTPWTGFLVVGLLLWLSCAPVARAEEAPAEPGTKLGKIWKGYTSHMDGVLQRVIDLDLWGVSTPQLPKGILKIKYQYNHQVATKKYDDDGNEVPIAPSLGFPDVLGDLVGAPGDDVFFVDLQGTRGGGKGAGHTIQMSYGIIDRLDFYIELPFQHAEVRFDVQYKAGDLEEWKWNAYQFILRSDLRTKEGFWQFVENMGRPRLKEEYVSDVWDLGDIHMGLSWNYYKGKYFAAATTNRIYLPTGKQPGPNNNIELFTGAALPAGVGAFGLSTTQGFDFRLPRPLDWAVFNIEFTYEYRFSTRRDAPIFPQRSPYFETIFGLLASEEPDIAALFPDLSHMGDHYRITYGHSFDGEVGLTLNPFRILPIGVKYAAGWSQKPKVESSSQDFIDYVESVEIVGEQVQHVLAVGTGISLIPFYIPLNLVFEYRFPLGGKGAFIVDQNFVITTELFLAF